MKNIFIALVCIVAMVGCNNNQERICYAECKLISNPENSSYVQFWFSGGTQYYQEPNLTPLPVGFTLTSAEYLLDKDVNIMAMAMSTGINGVSSNNQLEIKFFVNGDLEETRKVNGYSGTTNFIVP